VAGNGGVLPGDGVFPGPAGLCRAPVAGGRPPGAGWGRWRQALPGGCSPRRNHGFRALAHPPVGDCTETAITQRFASTRRHPPGRVCRNRRHIAVRVHSPQHPCASARKPWLLAARLPRGSCEASARLPRGSPGSGPRAARPCASARKPAFDRGHGAAAAPRPLPGAAVSVRFSHVCVVSRPDLAVALVAVSLIMEGAGVPARCAPARRARGPRSAALHTVRRSGRRRSG
jgi:hypothetical protein